MASTELCQLTGHPALSPEAAAAPIHSELASLLSQAVSHIKSIQSGLLKQGSCTLKESPSTVLGGSSAIGTPPPGPAKAAAALSQGELLGSLNATAMIKPRGKFDVSFYADGQVVLKGTKDLVVSFSGDNITQLLRIAAGGSTQKRSQIVACLSKPVTIGKTNHDYVVFQFPTAEAQSVVAPDNTTVVHQGKGGLAALEMLRQLSKNSTSFGTPLFVQDQACVNSAKNGPEGIDCTLGAAPNRVYLMDGGLLRTPAMLYVPLSEVDKVGINKIGGGRTFMAVVLLEEGGGHEFDNIDASEEGAFMQYVNAKRINEPKKEGAKNGGAKEGGGDEKKKKKAKAAAEDTDDEEGVGQDDDDDDDSDDDEDSEDDSDFNDGKSSSDDDGDGGDSEDSGGDDDDDDDDDGDDDDAGSGKGRAGKDSGRGAAKGGDGKDQAPIVVDGDSEEEEEEAGDDEDEDEEDGSESGEDDEDADDADDVSDASGDNLDAAGLDLDAPRAKRTKR